MKKILYSIGIGLCLVLTANAQGVSKLFGLVGGGVQNNHSSNGFLFNTDSSGNNMQVQYPFPATLLGASPANLEMAAYNGKLYGTTYTGGANNYGTIFEYDPVTNNYSKKFDFGPNVSVTGGGPRGSLLLYNNKFYGLAADYGVSGAGCLFEWDPATNVYTKKFDFTGDGAYPGNNPHNSLRLLNGKMYGTTAQGGSSNLGVVFEWDPVANTSVKLYELTGPNGWGFYNNVTVYNNKLYCASHQGGTNGYGALYVIDPALPYGANTTVIKQFDASTGGLASNNEMIVYNNKLYGCLNAGGNNSGGTLFELNPAGNIFTKLVDFDYTATGNGPLGKLVANGSKFLGMCSGGGTNGTGTVYEWDPANPNTVVKKQSFGINNFDNPVNPGSTFAAFNGKFYGTHFNGGFVNQGTLFEYNYTANTITKKKTFNAAENGRIPYGKPVLLNGKLYGTCYQGPQEVFGTPYGCLWSFDPSTSTYSRRFLFSNVNNADNGRAPVSSPIAYNGKLYGTTTAGGNSDRGLLYEFDPTTDGFVKQDILPIGGAYPIGEPALYNNKLYGMTNAGGAGNNGIIYSYDPATSILAKLYDVQNSGGNTPNGGFAVYNNKLYGTTSFGGANNNGTIFMYDPVANTAATVFSLDAATGYSVSNAMTLYNNKFYGTALAGGTSGRGVIFQFDPANNTYTVVHNFTTTPGTNGYDPKGELTVSGNKLYCITQEGITIVKVVEFDPATNTVTSKSTYTVDNYNVPVTHNGLTVVPAFIANGLANNCETYPVVVINAGNNNRWVPILNTAGDVVAEIKANGNNLGNVTASTYINTGAVREDGLKQLYMDRNITITVQNQPSSNVDIRLYVKTSEYLALKNALNSLGQPSGISSINDIAIFKNTENCPAIVTINAGKVTTTASPYEYGYVLSASTGSFSTFFFAKNTFVTLPVSLLSFDAVKDNNKILVNWNTENEVNLLRFEVEKSIDGTNFGKIADVTAKGNSSNTYSITDNNPFTGNNYYRLKQLDKDGRFTYSNTVRVDFSKKYSITILPNPVKDYMVIQGAAAFKKIEIIDVTGKLVKEMNKDANNRYTLPVLAKGVYIVRLSNAAEVVATKIIIE